MTNSISGNQQPSQPHVAVTLRRTTAALRRGWRSAAAVLTSVMALVLLYLLVSPAVYEARSTVIVRETDRGTQALTPFATGLVTDRNTLVELEVLKSLDMSKRVADRLIESAIGDPSVASFPLLGSHGRSLPDAVVLAQTLQRKVQIGQLRRDVAVVEIVFRSTDPREAESIANLFANEYTNRNLETSRVQAGGVRDFVEDQLVEQSTRLQSIESTLQRYREEENVIALDEEARQLSQRTAELQSLKDQAQVELVMVEAQIASLETEFNRIQPNLTSRVSSAGIGQEIASLQHEIAQLELNVDRKYALNPDLKGKEHLDRDLPRWIDQVEGLKLQVAIKAEDYVSGIMSTGGVSLQSDGAGIPDALAYVSHLQRQITEKNIEAAAGRARIGVLSRRLARYESELSQIPAQSRTLAGLQREQASTEQTYRWLIERFEEARMAEQSELGSIAMLDWAVLPTEPVAPRWRYSLVMGAFVGMMLAFLTLFGRELLDETVRMESQLHDMGVPVVGVLSRLPIRQKGKGDLNELVVIHSPASAMTRRFHHIVTRLDLAHRGDPASVVIVTSPSSGEGKTTTAVNVATTFAATGRKTLLIDANVWRPRAHDIVGGRRIPGLVDLLYRPTLMEDAIQTTVHGNLNFLPSGDSSLTGVLLVSAHDVHTLVTFLRQSYDRIVVDAAGLNLSGGAVGLAAVADAVLLVVRSGVSQSSDVIGAVNELAEVGAPIPFVVLNDTERHRPDEDGHVETSPNLVSSTPIDLHRVSGDGATVPKGMKTALSPTPNVIRGRRRSVVDLFVART